jgi:hypothetical protein
MAVTREQFDVRWMEVEDAALAVGSKTMFDGSADE